MCDEGAITIEDNRFIIDENVATGCMNCQAVCFSVKINKSRRTNSLKIAHRHITIIMMHNVINAALLFAWEPNATLCPICTQHQKQGMAITVFIICSMQK